MQIVAILMNLISASYLPAKTFICGETRDANEKAFASQWNTSVLCVFLEPGFRADQCIVARKFPWN